MSTLDISADRLLPRPSRRFWLVGPLVVLVASIVTGAAVAAEPGDWPAIGRDRGGMRHSPLTKITRDNVARLKPAWTYRTGELERVKIGSLKSKIAFEATPLVVDGTLYVSTPSARVIALDAATGRERWTYDPHLSGLAFAEGASRGVGLCAADGSQQRILVGTLDARLIALDAATGKPCDDFGIGGAIALTAGLKHAAPGLYAVTSPPAIVGDTVVVGSAIGDNQRFDAASGVVRAFDVRSGKLRWSWDPIPRTRDDAAAASWQGDRALETGAANVWSGISVDETREWVYLPTSCPAPDFYGGNRLGDNLYANSVVALDGATGDRQWHFQVVHHDIWDYDVAAQPVLFDYRQGERMTPAVAVGTKMGHVFILDRATGKPLVPVEERPVPKSDVPGEEAAPTQPFPALPALGLHNPEPWGRNDGELAWSKKQFATLRYDGIFTPPSIRGSLLAPANVGGINWSGMTIDPERQLLVTNVNRTASAVRLIPRKEFTSAGGSRLGEERAAQLGTPYAMARSTLRLPDVGLPATKPPWGTLAAIDLATGKLRWEVPLGWMVDPKDEPRAAEWGSVNLGGAITTASGLTFIAASKDGHLRAFDTETGKILWQAELPAGGQATPMTYLVNNEQYLVIAAGGHARLGTKLGDYLVAFKVE